MAAVVVIAIYIVIGAGAAISVYVAGTGRGTRPILMFVLWPFLLPGSLFGESLPRGGRTKERSDRLDTVAHSLKEAFDHARADGRERRVVEAYVERIRTREGVVSDLEAAIRAASPAVRAKLEEIRVRSVAQLDEGVGMLEEMVAQLLLLRFSSLTSNEGDERQRMEDLMAKIEALTSLSVEEEARAP